jgi:hypothetical protein
MTLHKVEPKNSSDSEFLENVRQDFELSSTDFARAYYLFATARLKETYNSQEIYERYPILNERSTVDRLQQILKAQTLTLRSGDGTDSETHRFFVSAVNSYLDSRLAAEADAFRNERNQLQIPVEGLGLLDEHGKLLTSLLYEDVAGYLKKTLDADTRQALYNRMAVAYETTLSKKFIALFQQENALMAELGHPDVRSFHAWASGHNFEQLGEQAEHLLKETETLYRDRMSIYYKQRTGRDFASQALRSDISYTLHGPSEEMAVINAQFPKERLVELAQKTFDRLGLRFSELTSEIDFRSLDEYDMEIVAKTTQASEKKEPLQRILLDIARRDGKPSRAYVYPAVVPAEIYLSVKPEGGLDDYLAFFHESGHALHFVNENPELGFAKNLLGNNTATETYAYTFQNLFLNRHWLEYEAGLSADQAQLVVNRRALEDLYMLRRYAAKMLFELDLFQDVNGPAYRLDNQAAHYADLLTRGCGFRYDPEGWTRDVDARFYVADYFTAWSLEAQLRQVLCQKFGSGNVAEGEDWYLNPNAGEFLQKLWYQGNITQQALSTQLGYESPTDLTPLLKFMALNLS